MASSVGEGIQDRYIYHAVNLARLEAGQQREILIALKNLERDLIAKIQRSADDGTTLSNTRARALLREVQAVIETHYTGIYQTNRDQLIDLGTFEATQVAHIVNTTLGATVLAAGVPESVVRSMVRNSAILGVPLKNYWDRQASSLRDDFATAMRAGIFAGETNDDLIRRVRGTKDRQFRDGLMQTSRSRAAALVRTSAQSVLNDARMEMYKNNADVIKGYQAHVTLDNRTSELCMSRSGMAWDSDGNPLDGTDTDIDFPGPPPWHVNCRTDLIPIVKSIGEILGNPDVDDQVQKELDKLPPSMQASMDGAVPAAMNYEDWLASKSEPFQRSVLGDTKWQLWKDGQISFRDLVDETGRPLTLKQLQAVGEVNVRDAIAAREAIAKDPLTASSRLFEQANPRGVDTLARFTTREGVLTEERQMLHDAIRKEVFEGFTAVERPVRLMMGGGSGAGKDTLAKVGIVKMPKNTIDLDPDKIKAKFPEYKELLAKGDTSAAALVHEESSLLAKQLLDEATNGSYSVLFNGTGDGSIDGLREKVRLMHLHGQKVVAQYVTIPIDEALRRAEKRAIRTGRKVPKASIYSTHAKVSAVVPKAIKEGLFDEFYLWDNSGTEPRLIAEARGTRLTIHQRPEWEAFLKKADEEFDAFNQ